MTDADTARIPNFNTFHAPKIGSRCITHIGFKHWVPEMQKHFVIKVHITEAAQYAYLTGEWVSEAYDEAGTMTYAKSWMRCGRDYRSLGRIGVGAYGDTTILSYDTATNSYVPHSY